jgi:hypothetical protein
MATGCRREVEGTANKPRPSKIKQPRNWWSAEEIIVGLSNERDEK